MAGGPEAGSGRRLRILGASAVVVVLVVGALVAWRLGSSSTGPGDAAGAPPTTPSTITSTTAAPTTATSAPATTTSSTAPVCDRRADLDARAADLPPERAAPILAALSDAAWAEVERSISVWIEGYGEVVAVDPDRALLPASNEKVLTAIGARLLLDPGQRFRTDVVRGAGGELVLVGGGDPTLRTRGPHSLEALAGQVRSAAVADASSLRVDASRFEQATTARGWQDWQVPTYVGPMSALVVDDNRARRDGDYLADPALGNAQAFVAALRTAGVSVGGVVTHGVASAPSTVVATLESPTIAELSDEMLSQSDNEIAESLVRLIGDGRSEAGAARIEAVLSGWCLHLGGDVADGSGLSREDLRSARDLRRLLQVASEQPWADDVWSGLPVAGRSGTLRGRMTGPTTNGNVTAKTGTIIGGTALSGYATTADGRAVVFSVIVNGEPAAAELAAAAVDRLVVACVG